VGKKAPRQGIPGLPDEFQPGAAGNHDFESREPGIKYPFEIRFPAAHFVNFVKNEQINRRQPAFVPDDFPVFKTVVIQV
jgi:hypothetical protein